MINMVLFFICFFLGGAGAWFISRYGPVLGLVDVPNHRSSHAIPTPKGGGVGVAVAYIVACLLLEIPFTFWLPVAFIALFSFFGDRVDMLPRLRLPVQFAAAFFFLMTPHSFMNSPFYLFPMAVFVTGTANFYNFMDGINGIAGITGAVGFGLLAFFSLSSGADAVFTTLCICLALSCLAFLPFNIPGARVFMGDVGSILLGFIFGGMTVILSKDFLDFICVAAFLFPFYADELTTMYVRVKDGEDITAPHRRHLYQLLANEKGIRHWKVSVGYGLVQLFVGVSVLTMKPFGFLVVLSLLTAFFCAFTWVSHSVRVKVP